jgi:transcriptional regulator with XRE-family HTH domain
VDIGSRVRAIRKAKGLTQEGLARRAEVNLQVVGMLERGETVDPHISNLRSIARALDVSVAELGKS